MTAVHLAAGHFEINALVASAMIPRPLSTALRGLVRVFAGVTELVSEHALNYVRADTGVAGGYLEA